MASCPAPLIWKKILFWRLRRISRSSTRRERYMMRNARIKSSRPSLVGSALRSVSIVVLVSMDLPKSTNAGSFQELLALDLLVDRNWWIA